MLKKMDKIKIKSKNVSKNRIVYSFDSVIGIDYLDFYKSIGSGEWRVNVKDWDCLNRKLIVLIENVLRGLNSNGKN